MDLSYYLGKEAVEALDTLDIPVQAEQVVTFNLKNSDELSPASELIPFLLDIGAESKYWIILASSYAKLNRLDEAFEFIDTALNQTYFKEEDKKMFQSLKVWLNFKSVYSGINTETCLNNATSEINQLSYKIQDDQETSPTTSFSNLLCQGVMNLYSDDDNAIDVFDKILRVDQNNCFAILGKAQAVVSKTKNYSMALKLYQQALILNPVMKPDPRLGIGLCFWFLKDEKMALKSWKRALEIDPNNVKARIFLNLAKFHETFNNSISDEEFLTNYQYCLRELKEIYSQNVNDSTVLLTLASYYFAKGDLALVEKIVGKITNKLSNESNKKFKVSKYQSITLSECSTWLGRIYFARGEFTQSSKLFQEAIKFNDSNIVAKFGLAQSQYNLGSVEEASLTFEMILKNEPKCLEVNYSLGVLYADQKRDLAISYLEKYIRLSNNRGLSSSSKEETDRLLNKEPITLNAFLLLSKLYKQKDINQALSYLTKAIESKKSIGKESSLPLEIYNNIGVFQFIKQNYDEACSFFQDALTKVDEDDLSITLNFNLARSKEISNQSEALQIYENLISECPNYFSAKLRILFLNCINDSETKESIKEEIESLLKLNASDLEIRSFYGWFAKNFGKKVGMSPDIDTNHQKETLVEYNSHDCYALLSLGNIYCIMARDLKKSPSFEEKRKKYYIRAMELFSKVISIDSKNVYAAQGLAITYIENQNANKGLDILRKIRDSLNDISVYLNLGHVLCELKQFSKSIENYELALGRFTDGFDSKILTFLGRAWLLRGVSEENLQFFKKSLTYSKEALSHSNIKATALYNVAYVQFQIAEFITKQPVNQRKIEDIEEAITDLNEGIDILTKLSSDEERHPPYPREELKGRANLGSTTLLNRLKNVLDETKENIKSVEQRLEIAKQTIQQEKQAKLKLEEELIAKQLEKELELAKERATLVEQAQQWAEQSRNAASNDDEKDDKLFNEESEVKNNKKKTKKTKKGKKKIIKDEDESSASETEAHGKRKLDDNEQENSSKKKKQHLSKEFIEDSSNDEEEYDKSNNSNDEDGLF